jgi:predicted Zn-dependent protease
MYLPQQRLLAASLLLLSSASCFAQQADVQKQVAAHAGNAQKYLSEKRPDLAIPELQALVSIEPQNADAQANLGVLLFFQNDYPNAIVHMKAALAVQPDLMKIRGLLGIAEGNTGDSAAATEDLAATFPQLQDLKFKRQIGLKLIELYTAAEDLEKAASVVAQLRREFPEDKEVIYASYRIYSQLVSESILSLSFVDPNSAQMHQVLAHEEARQGKTNEAIAQYRQAIAIDPRLPGIHFELAELLNTSADTRMKQEALQEYLLALKENPLDVKSQSRLGDVYLQQSDLKQAFSYYSQALALQPNNPDANFGLAKTLIAMGQENKALPILEHVVQIDPTNATAHYRLSALYRKQGRSEEAKHELDEFLKYKQMKEKLRALYKEMQVQPDEIHDDEKAQN